MDTLSFEQQYLLATIAKHPLSSGNKLLTTKLTVIQYLSQLDLVIIDADPVFTDSGVFSKISHVKISQKGKAYLSEYRRTLFYFTIPTLISILSLLISVFALLFK